VERWLALRDREHLTYRELSQRSGIPANTLAHWAWRLRREQATLPAESAFVELVATAAPAHRSGSRVEIILRGERRVVVDASIDADALARVLTAVDRC
jgi:hypothetical protein